MNRTDFPILKEHVYGKPLVYLDNAATSQKPTQVLEAINYAYSHLNANIHRGVHKLSQMATMEHENARKIVASFIGAKSSNEIVFTKGTTDSINMLAFSFGEWGVNEGDNVIVSALEHHSNIVPWQMLCLRKNAQLRVLPLKDDLTVDVEKLEELIDSRTRIISVTQVSNVLGVLTPIDEVVRKAHSHGVPVCVDGAQSVSHMPVNVQEMGCDFFVFSAHKMYGPTGLGVLYGKEDWLDKLPPAEGGGEMIEHVSWEGTTFNVLPYKFEAGTPDFNGSFAFGKALDYVSTIGMNVIAEHEKNLMIDTESLLRELDLGSAHLHIYAEEVEKFGVLSLNVYQGNGTLIHPYDIGVLLDRQGVAIRTGHHCAEPLMDLLGIPGTVRLSVGLYNEREDIDAFADALYKAVSMLS